MSATREQLNEVEARILRKVAAALRGNYERGYSSMGGPQDHSEPSSFDASSAARDLEAEASKIEKEGG